MPAHITFWSTEDNEWVSTFIDDSLKGLSGLGLEPHVAEYELQVAYIAWIKSW